MGTPQAPAPPKDGAEPTTTDPSTDGSVTSSEAPSELGVASTDAPSDPAPPPEAPPPPPTPPPPTARATARRAPAPPPEAPPAPAARVANRRLGGVTRAKVWAHGNIMWDGRTYAAGEVFTVDREKHSRADYEELVEAGRLLEPDDDGSDEE